MNGAAPRRLTHGEVEQIRSTRRRSVLLFVTDRCPVGCGHCSVDSRADSPSISDFTLFDELVDTLCGSPELEVVGISGGEPFVERRGLSLASRRIAEAGKLQVVYTSGTWAAGATPAPWIDEILRRCSTVYLSTDAFHARRIADDRFVRAARAIAAAGAWIVVQVIGLDRMVEAAEQRLREAFGPGWAGVAEINVTRPVGHGRAAGVFERTADTPGHAYGPCSVVASPVVRYDGRVTGCCNESVVMGRGPSRLRRRAGTGPEIDAAIDAFHSDQLLRAVSGAGLGLLTRHPRFADLASERYSSNCELCWAMLDRFPDPHTSDPLLDAINTLAGNQ